MYVATSILQPRLHVIQCPPLDSGLHAWESLTEIIEHLHIIYIIFFLSANIC